MRDDILDMTSMSQLMAELRMAAGSLMPATRQGEELDAEEVEPFLRPAAAPRPYWPPKRHRPTLAQTPRREQRYYQRVNRGLDGNEGPRPWR